MAGLCQKVRIYDDTVGLDNIGNTVDGAAFFERKVVAGQLAVEKVYPDPFL